MTIAFVFIAFLCFRLKGRKLSRLVGLLLALGTISCAGVCAHPVAQGSMRIVVGIDGVRLEARVSLEELTVARTGFASAEENASVAEACRQHGEYLLRHVFVSADGGAMTGRLERVIIPGTEGLPTDRLLLTLFFPWNPQLPAPFTIEIRQNVLNEIEYAPGNPWESSYVVSISVADNPLHEGCCSSLLLTLAATAILAGAKTLTDMLSRPLLVLQIVQRRWPKPGALLLVNFRQFNVRSLNESRNIGG